MSLNFGPTTYVVALRGYENTFVPLYVSRDASMAEAARSYVARQSAQAAEVRKTRSQAYADIVAVLKTLPTELGLRLEAAIKKAFQELDPTGIPIEFGEGAEVVILELPEVTSVADVEG